MKGEDLIHKHIHVKLLQVHFYKFIAKRFDINEAFKKYEVTKEFQKGQDYLT